MCVLIVLACILMASVNLASLKLLQRLVYMCGVYGWCLCVVSTGGVYGWCLCVVFMVGVYEWCLCMVYTAGVNVWCIRAVYTGGIYG